MIQSKYYSTKPMDSRLNQAYGNPFEDHKVVEKIIIKFPNKWVQDFCNWRISLPEKFDCSLVNQQATSSRAEDIYEI